MYRKLTYSFKRDGIFIDGVLPLTNIIFPWHFIMSATQVFFSFFPTPECLSKLNILQIDSVHGDAYIFGQTSDEMDLTFVFTQPPTPAKQWNNTHWARRVAANVSGNV
jgi:hypothetical protein